VRRGRLPGALLAVALAALGACGQDAAGGDGTAVADTTTDDTATMTGDTGDATTSEPEVGTDVVDGETATVPSDVEADSAPGDLDADAVEPPDASDETAEVDVPAVVACTTPSFIDAYPPPLPPFPYGLWPAADGCLDAPHDVIIVLGCPSEEDGSPADCQVKRAEMADHLYERGWAGHVIVTGAAVHTPWVEATALKALLVGRGVPADVIIEEPLARHTDENIYYATRIMQDHGWLSAIVVSEDPGHLMFTGLCDANCCVALGRMVLRAFWVGGIDFVKAGHYTLAPPGPGTTEAECAHLEAIALCVNLDQRLACKDDFQLDE